MFRIRDQIVAIVTFTFACAESTWALNNRRSIKKSKGIKYMKTKVSVVAKTVAAVVCGLGLLAAIIAVTARARAESVVRQRNNHDHNVQHVLLISVDGLHQSDLAWYVQNYPQSTLAALTTQGVDYSNASTPFPSDS